MLNDKEQGYVIKNLEADNLKDYDRVIDFFNAKRKKDGEPELSVSDILDFYDSLADKENRVSAEVDVEPNSLTTSKVKSQINRNTKQEESKYLADLVARAVHPKPKDYRILSDKTQAGLQQKVNIDIKRGYVPFGGVSAAAFGISPVGGNQYLQAMIKY